MQLASPWVDLGPVPAAPLRARVAALDDAAWHGDTLRQDRFAVHAATRSVLLLWCDRSRWPELTPEPRPMLTALDAELRPVLAAAVARMPHPVVVATAMLALLPPGARIAEHVDADPFFAHAHRVHVPLLLPRGVRFVIDDQVAPLREGRLYEIDNLRRHSVRNDGDSPRVHLIADLLPTASLLAAG